MKDLISHWWDLIVQLTGNKELHICYNNLFEGYFTQKSTLLFSPHSRHSRHEPFTFFSEIQQMIFEDTEVFFFVSVIQRSSHRFGVKLMRRVGYLAMASNVSHPIRSLRSIYWLNKGKLGLITTIKPIRAAYSLCVLRIHEDWALMCWFIPDL